MNYLKIYTPDTAATCTLQRMLSFHEIEADNYKGRGLAVAWHENNTEITHRIAKILANYKRLVTRVQFNAC